MIYKLLLLVALSGCASATITSYTDPSLKKPYQSLAVWYVGDALDTRVEMERDLVARCFEQHQVRGLASVDIIPPTRNVPPKEMLKLLKAAGAQALVTNTPLKTSTGPTSYITNIYTGYTAPIEGTHYATVTFDVWDLKTGNKVWTGAIRGSGDYSGMVEGEVKDALCNRLSEDGVINRPKQPKGQKGLFED